MYAVAIDTKTKEAKEEKEKASLNLSQILHLSEQIEM